MNTVRVYAFALVLSLVLTAAAPAQVASVVTVGITPTCPYGISACAVGAREGLRKLGGVQTVALHPDRYNCTFDLHLDRGELPDLETWRKQFRAVVGDVFVFRGVELTVTGTVVEREGQVFLDVPHIQTPLRVTSLEHKLQWNFRKQAAREPEPSERTAFADLAARAKKEGSYRAEITGPFRLDGAQPTLEVREFFEAAAEPARDQKR